MNYCYECGTALEIKMLETEDTPRQVCPACHWVHYKNPRVLVGVHLHHQDKMFWMKRGTPPNKGLWTFPGGFLEEGESLQEAAARELYEETHIKISPNNMIPFGMLSLLTMDQVYLSFRCHCDNAIAGAITEESADWGWFSEQDAPWDELAYSGSIDQVRQSYQCIRNGAFPFRVGVISSQGMVYNHYP
ncbi:MAG: NUDIX hydrolase [Spongiibacteraceae bacterium]